MKSDNETLATTVLNLPDFDTPQRNRWPLKMSWDAVMFQTKPQRDFYRQHFDSPDKRLRNKNTAPFRMDF